MLQSRYISCSFVRLTVISQNRQSLFLSFSNVGLCYNLNNFVHKSRRTIRSTRHSRNNNHLQTVRSVPKALAEESFPLIHIRFTFGKFHEARYLNRGGYLEQRAEESKGGMGWGGVGGRGEAANI